eukprot:gene23508-biopygen18040
MRLALGSSQRPLLNTPPSRVAVSEDAEDNAYPPLSPLQRSSATPSQPPVHSPLQEFITPRETFTGATATQAASPPHMTTNNLFSSEEEVESPSKRLARTPRQLPEPTPVNQLPASQPSGNRSSSSSDNSGSRPSQSPHGPWGNPGGDPASSSDSDGVPDDEADTGGPPGQPEDQPPSPPDSDDEPPPPPEEDEVPPPPNFQGDVSDADSNDSERHVALMISVGSVLSWQLPTEGSQLHGGSVSHTKAWLLMMKSYIVNIKRDLAVEELWEQMMVQVYENSQPFVLFTDNRAAWIQECNALQTQSSLNGVLQVNEHGQPIMNPATWKLKLIHFYELVKTGLALALKVTPLDAKEEYEKFDCYDNAGLLYPMPRILMSEFTKKYEEFDIRAGQPHYREAMAKVAKLLDRMAPTLKENFGSYKDVTPLGCWAIAKLYKLDQDQHTLERLSGIAQTEASKRDDMTAQGMLLCVSKPPTQRPTVMPRQTAFPVTQDPSAPKGNNALVVSFRQTPDAETQASSQAIYKPTFDPSTDGTGSTAAIPLPSARVSRHVTQAQHRASQDLLMDEMTVLQRDLDLMFREVQNLHEFNRALQVRATAVETAQRAACVTHNPVDTFVRDYTASGQLSPSTATLLQGTEPSYGVPYLANLSHQTGLSFKSTTGLLQCVNLMVLVDTGSGLNFISQSMADSLGHDPLPCHHKTIAFNDVKSSLTKEIQMPVIFCSETPNEISVRATFVIAPDNTIFDALIGTPLMAMPGISALPDISQEKLTLRPYLHLSSAEHTATAFYMTLLMHMVAHAHSMESYSYETNSDNTLYLGDVNLLHSTPSPTPAGDNYKEPQDFFTTQLDDVYWRPCQEFLGGQAAVYQASTSCALPVHLDPPTPASLLPGRLQGGLTSCLSHMDPNYLQEGGINNSMPDGAVTPNADRGALHPDCDLFIGHHRDGTEAQRKEMAAMLNRMTPAVARTMEDLREGYKGIVPPMHIEKDNDKQAFTSPYRKPPIEKLAQDKKVMETELGKRGLLKFSKVFIDDILVHSATFADHIKDVEAVLQCLIDIGLRIHPDKSCFALDAVDFLGFDVSNHGLTPQAAKVQDIQDLPYPSNLKDLKTILGGSAPDSFVEAALDSDLFDDKHLVAGEGGSVSGASLRGGEKVRFLLWCFWDASRGDCSDAAGFAVGAEPVLDGNCRERWVKAVSVVTCSTAVAE